MARDNDDILRELGLDLDLHHRIFDAVDRSFAEAVLARPGRPARMAYFDELPKASAVWRAELELALGRMLTGRTGRRKVTGSRRERS